MCSFISCACRHRWKWLLWVEVLHCNLTTYTALREYVLCTAREHKSLQDFIIFYPLQNELVTCDTLVTHSTTLKAIYQPQRWLWPPSLARWLACCLLQNATDHMPTVHVQVGRTFNSWRPNRNYSTCTKVHMMSTFTFYYYCNEFY